MVPLKMIPKLVAPLVTALVFSAPAQAMCTRLQGWDVKSAINGLGEYVTCVNVEHADAINQHSILIERMKSDVRAAAESSIEATLSARKVEVSYDDLAREVSRLRFELDKLEKRVHELEVEGATARLRAQGIVP